MNLLLLYSSLLLLYLHERNTYFLLIQMLFIFIFIFIFLLSPFSSLIITCFAMIRAAIEYIKFKITTLSKQSEASSSIDGGSSRFCRCCSLIHILSCLISCSLCCFDTFLKFVSKHAYIQVALTGKPFLASSKRSFGLLVRNLGR